MPPSPDATYLASPRDCPCAQSDPSSANLPSGVVDTGGGTGQSAFVLARWSVAQRVWLIAALSCLAGCASDATTRPAPSIAAETSTVVPPTVTGSLAELSDSDLAEILAVVVPVAIAANPGGSGEVRVSTATYVIADSLGQASGNDGFQSVTFEGGSIPLSTATRMAIEATLSPAHAEFVAADLTQWMLLLAEPSVEDNAVVVTYEQRCGGEPDALCGSGGAFRVERVDGSWRVVIQLSGWIS